MKILIANRGEIARRVMRTAHRLAHHTVAAYADPDQDAPFVREATTATRLGPAPLRDSYLSIERYVELLARTGADAVHPGYGFLSENADFARAVLDAGARWIGPSPDVIAEMGSKIRARSIAAGAGVPLIPGYAESQDFDDLAGAAERLGFPVLVKAAAGGGGKGIRIARTAGELARALGDAGDEAERAFGDRSLIVERYIERPRHVEVQIVGDRHGAVIHLGTRECSVQRRYQKVLEECPAPNLPDATRAGLEASALRLGAAIGYDSAGTVEFIVDDDTGDFFFLEVNTRLQVEHTVTEVVTGLDIVELQIRVADGEKLPLRQESVTWHGHAFEARVNAEDPAQDFAPRTGTVSHLVVPAGVRWDSAIERGSMVTPHYDSMVAKLVVHGEDRPGALRRLAGALDGLVIGGVSTNTGFLRWLVDAAPVVAGRVTTRFLDDSARPLTPEPATVEAAAAWTAARRLAADRSAPWSALAMFRVTPHEASQPVGLVDLSGAATEVALAAGGAPAFCGPASVDRASRSVAVNVDGYTHTFAVPTRTDRWAPALGASTRAARAVTAPFPAVVADVLVAPGASVGPGDPLLVLEAMKMLHTLTAAGIGVVAEVRVAVDDQVASDQVLVTFTDDDGPRPHGASDTEGTRP